LAARVRAEHNTKQKNGFGYKRTEIKEKNVETFIRTNQRAAFGVSGSEEMFEHERVQKKKGKKSAKSL